MLTHAERMLLLTILAAYRTNRAYVIMNYRRTHSVEVVFWKSDKHLAADTRFTTQEAA